MEYGQLILNPRPEDIPQDWASLRDAGLDSETFGVKFNDRAFSFQISDGKYCLYWNLQEYIDAPWVGVMSEREASQAIEYALRNVDQLYIANAKFDMRRLAMIGLNPRKYDIYCNHSLFRLINSDALKVSLEEQGEFFGYPKDTTVKDYIKKHALYEPIQVCGYTIGRKERYDLVPWHIIQPYACRDAYLSLMIGREEVKRLGGIDTPIVKQEMELTRALFTMEETGIPLDVPYIEEKIKEHSLLMEQAKERLGFDFKDHHLWYEKKFKEHKLPITLHWKKRTPTFTTKVLEKHRGIPFIDNAILYRYHHNLLFNFYLKMYYFKDEDDVLHTDLIQYQAATGRLSSRQPNLLNTPSRAGKEVKRAFVPAEGFVFSMKDYQAAELRITYDRSNETKMIKRFLSGEDMHAALAKDVRCSRDDAKTVIFAKLYGSGVKGIANTLDRDYKSTKTLVDNITKATPNVHKLTLRLKNAINIHRCFRNPYGRLLKLPKDKSYKALNYLIQSTLADCMKQAIVRIDKFIHENGLKSRMVLCVHDSLLTMLHSTESSFQKDIDRMMIESYKPVNKLHLAVTSDWSDKNYGDTIEGEYKNESTRAS